MFLNVPVRIDGKEVFFNFLLSENAYGMNCKVLADGYFTYLDKDLIPFMGDMPAAWLPAALGKLVTLLSLT